MKNHEKHIKLTSRRKALFSVPLLFCIFCSTSYAGLSGVKKIIITPSSLNTSHWLQISEVVAIESSSNADVALATKGATAVSTSLFTEKTHAGNVISGVAPDRYPRVYHSGRKDKSPVLEITLASESEIDRITLYGRADCCFSRDFYDLTLVNSENKVVFQKKGLDASDKSHAVHVDLRGEQPASSPVQPPVNSEAEKPVVTNEGSAPLIPALKEQRSAANPAGITVDSRPKNYFRDLYNQAIQQKDAGNYEGALKLFDQIVSESNGEGYWASAAKSQRRTVIVVDGSAFKQANSGQLAAKEEDKSEPATSVKRMYELDKQVRKLEKNKQFDESIVILDQIIRESRNLKERSSVDWGRYAADKKKKLKLSKIKYDQYLEEKRKQDIKIKEENKKKNEEFFAQWQENIDKQAEDYERSKKLAIQEKAAAEERERRIIKSNNERYSLPNLKFSEASVIDFHQLQIGKTKKSEAISLYDSFLRRGFAKEVTESDAAFILRQTIQGPRVMRRTWFVEQSAHQIHDDISLQCFKYSGVLQNKIVSDCLYFYRDVLAGGVFERGQNNCGQSCDLIVQELEHLVPFFPEDIHHSSYEGTRRIERGNDSFVLNSLIWGHATTNIKTTTKTVLTPVGTVNYSSSTQINARICIMPKEFLEVLSGYGEKGLYTCN